MGAVWRNVNPPVDVVDVAKLAWWPDVALMRGKLPHDSDSHYWPCVEMADPSCFPGGADNAFTSCAQCCDPGVGPTGNAACFVGDWTFDRCCKTPGGSGRFY